MIKLKKYSPIALAAFGLIALAPQASNAGNNQAYCREATKDVTIGNKARTIYGTACRQPGGAWVFQTAQQAQIKPAPTKQVVITAPQKTTPKVKVIHASGRVAKIVQPQKTIVYITKKHPKRWKQSRKYNVRRHYDQPRHTSARVVYAPRHARVIYR